MSAPGHLQGRTAGFCTLCAQEWLVVVIVDAGPMPKAVGAPGANGRVFIIVTLVVIAVIVMSVSISIEPVGDVILKFLEEKRE